MELLKEAEMICLKTDQTEAASLIRRAIDNRACEAARTDNAIPSTATQVKAKFNLLAALFSLRVA